MENIYRDPGQVASFGGIDAIHRAIRGKVSKKKIKSWLEGVDAYTLHKPVRRKFKTNRVLVHTIDQQWQADLVDMASLQKYNDGFRYILTCIDILSKHAWAYPLKSKRGEDIVAAFQSIFLSRKPKYLNTDAGKEFLNSRFQKFLKENGVRFFRTFNNTKCSVVERFNRTLKTKMWKYFTAHHTYRFIDVLDQFLQSYNNTYHSSIKRAPVEVNKDNESDVWISLYGNMTNAGKTTFAFHVGDLVRVSKHKLTFEKGYETNWTDELFKVTECVLRDPPVYRIKDLLDEAIEGTFYKHELQKVKPKNDFAVEKIIKKRKRKGLLEYQVKFKGYPAKFNQWIPSSDLFSL